MTDLLHGKATAPGRIRAYYANREAGYRDLLPYSCKLRRYGNNLPYELSRTSKDLRWGAGVKLVLDDYTTPEACRDDKQWGFILNDNNKDVGNITQAQSKFRLNTEAKEFSLKDSIIIPVGDFMDGEKQGAYYSIEDSWRVFYEALYEDNDAVIVVDLSALRPNGEANGRGLIATGAVGDGTDTNNTASFLAIYEWIARYAEFPTIANFIKLFGVLNNTLRRGGIYKNGIVCSSMHYKHPLIVDYLQIPLVEIPGSHKKSVGVDAGILDLPELTELVLYKVKVESVFLEKRDINKKSAYPNVCVGLDVPDDGTCLIWRVNYGMCESLNDIIEAYEDAARNLTTLHISWRKDNPDKAKYSLDLESDNQIGLDVMGLANYLALHKITYQDFIKAVDMYFAEDMEDISVLDDSSFDALALVCTIAVAQFSAIRICDEIMNNAGLPRLARIFCVEPAQSHSYETFDLSGRTTCRGIWPPIGRRVNFSTETRQSRTVMHGKVQTVNDLTEAEYERVHEQFQRLLDTSLRAHAISYDLRREPTLEWFTHFLVDSPLKTKYYTEITSTDQSHLQKVIQEVTI